MTKYTIHLNVEIEADNLDEAIRKAECYESDMHNL